LDAPEISSDGGLVLLKKTEERSGLMRRMADCLSDSRRKKSVRHTKFKMLSQRVFGICLGWEDCNDFDRLGDDPLYAVCLNGKPASQPTLSTFENGVGHRELHKMSKALARFFVERHQGQSPGRITLDLDATDDPAHGQQEFEFYHGFYGTHCFLPLLVFASMDDLPMELVAAVLRPGNSHAGRRSAAVLRRLVGMLRTAFPDTEILVRSDAGFALPEMYATCEELGLSYVISLPKNLRLEALSSDLMHESRALLLETGQKAKLFGEFGYAAGTWPQERRVIVKAEVTAKGENPRYVVTNLKGDPEQIYRLYALRGDSENRIKELKLDLLSGRTSCHRFSANCFRLLLHALAFILMTLVRELLRGTELERCTMAQIRLKLLKVAAIVQQSTRRILLRLPRGHPHAELLRSLAT
jgi:hypothetical protein